MLVKEWLRILIRCAFLYSAYSVANPPSGKELEQLFITDSPTEALKDVGTYGSADFNPETTYRIVMSPTIDKRSLTGVRIPKNLKETLAELKKSLPNFYVEQLKLSAGTDNRQRPTVDCSSGDNQTDRAVHVWAIVYWQLKSPASRLRTFFADNIGIDSEEAIASKIFDEFCGAYAK